MNDSINTLLNDLSSRLGCDVLDDDAMESGLNEEFSETQNYVATVADEIRQLATPDEAHAFTSTLSEFLDRSRSKALRAQSLKADIAKRQERITEARGEFDYLSAGRKALAEKVHHAMQALEAARAEYDNNELRLGIIERRIETGRGEMAALGRELDELTESEEGRK